MGVHLAEQTTIFLQAILTGMLLGLLYDVFRITRIAVRTPVSVVFAEDILFFLSCAVITFSLILSTLDGAVRFFILIGEIIGWVLYYFTFGVLIMRISVKIINAVKAVMRFLGRYILLPIWRVVYFLVTKILLPVNFLIKTVKKAYKRLKFRLKVGRMLLYNQYKHTQQNRAKSKSGVTHADEPEQKAEIT